MMFAPEFITDELAARVGWTLIHSLWQITLIGGLFWVINQALVRRSAHVRYIVGCLAMAFTLVVPVCWLVFATGTKLDRRSVERNSVAIQLNDSVDQAMFGGWFESAPNAPGSIHELPWTSAWNRIDTSSEKAGTLAIQQAIARTVATIWLLGIMLLSLRPALGFAHARRLYRVGRADVSASIHLGADRLADAMGIRGVVQVAQSTLAQVPCVVGWLCPVILLPASAITGMSHAELESILAHELAHIRRHDYIVNLVQVAIETVLFFHPIVWWVSRCMRREREYCCDDLAMQFCGDRVVFTDALLAVSGVKARSRLALASDGTVLFDRVERILDPGNRRNDIRLQRQRSRSGAVACIAFATIATASICYSGLKDDAPTRLPKETAMANEPNENNADDEKDDLAENSLLHAWSDAMNDRDLERIAKLLTEHPELGETAFFPRKKLKFYHAARYEPANFAAMTDDLELMETLFKGGLTPSFGFAAESPEMTELVVRYGKQSDAFDKATLSNELMTASWFPNLEIQRILLDAGADPNVRKSTSGIRPLMYVALRSDGEQSLQIARQLIERGADVNAKSYSGFGDERTRHDGYNHDVEHGHETPLHWAARKGNAPLVQLLLDHGADPGAKTTSVRLAKRDEDGFYLFEAGGDETPRDWAYQSGDEATIRLLCGDDALSNVAGAARAGMTDRVRTFIAAGEDVNAARNDGKTAIQYAIGRNDVELCRVLTDAGAEWPGSITTAVRFGIPAVVKTLLDTNPNLKEETLRDPDALFMNEWDLKPLHIESVRAVLDAKPESPVDLVLAGYLGDKDAAEAILAKRPDVIGKAIGAFPEIACYFVFDAPLLKRILDGGADLEARGRPRGSSPLQRATWTSQLESVRLLIERGANVEAQSHGGRWRTLDIAICQHRKVDHRIIQVLLDAGADPNVEFHNGYTVLDILHDKERDERVPDDKRETIIEWVRAAGGKRAQEL